MIELRFRKLNFNMLCRIRKKALSNVNLVDFPTQPYVWPEEQESPRNVQKRRIKRKIDKMTDFEMEIFLAKNPEFQF